MSGTLLCWRFRENPRDAHRAVIDRFTVLVATAAAGNDSIVEPNDLLDTTWVWVGTACLAVTTVRAHGFDASLAPLTIEPPRVTLRRTDPVPTPRALSDDAIEAIDRWRASAPASAGKVERDMRRLRRAVGAVPRLIQSAKEDTR